MRVRIVQLGKGIFDYVTEGPATVEMGLQTAGIVATAMDVRVNGREARPEQPLHDNDLVTIVPRIRGGWAPAGRREDLKEGGNPDG